MGFIFQYCKLKESKRDNTFWPFHFDDSSVDAGRLAGSCQPKTHIFFLKNHKTASSTVMNILFRFGEAHNLTFALPFQAQFSYPSYFIAKYVEGFSMESKKEFHIMCHHMRFQLTEVEKVMPNSTFYFTIVRNPVSHMESSFSYFKNIDVFHEAKSLEDFFTNTSKYYKTTSEKGNYAKNLMAFDLGFDNNGLESTKHFKLMCRAVDTMFDLVLISDYFDESLVLLKNALCWTFEDILSIPLNSRSNNTKQALSKETQDKIKNWNQLDWNLYVYFNRSFWNKVDNFGRKRMENEVEELRKKRTEIAQICLQGEVDPDQMQDKSLKPYQSGIARILGQNLKPGLKESDRLLCQKLITPEIQYTELLKKRAKNNLQ
ncbi:galactose-3-O-sulfotransferase 4-like [Pelobates fuscus]|uniref:galactose-3-O-sulfotransferase 4-like n=1 Tax=Pelobates fuscus TaxID=191477 RepID=UPI002FE443F0